SPRLNCAATSPAPPVTFPNPGMPGGTIASCALDVFTALLGGVCASAAATTIQKSSSLDSTAVTAIGWPSTLTTSTAHADRPPGDATTSSPPEPRTESLASLPSSSNTARIAT